MPVTSLRAPQLPDPLIRSRGRALRAGTEYTEAATEKTRQDIELAPAQESRAERLLKVQEQQEQRLKEQFDLLKGTEKGKQLDEYLNVSVAAWEQAKADGLSDEEANAFAWEAGLDFADRQHPGSRAAAAEQLAGSGFSPEAFDIRKLRSFLGERPGQAEAAGYAAKDTYVDSDGKEKHMWYDENGVAHKTDILAKTESGEPTDFEPPNNQEIEAAAELVKSDPRLKKLDRKEERIAAQIIATDIRQLMVGGESYDDAAAMAIAKLKRRIKDEPGWWSSKSKLDLSLGENEYLGSDGNIYVEDEDGGFRRKN